MRKHRIASLHARTVTPKRIKLVWKESGPKHVFRQEQPNLTHINDPQWSCIACTYFNQPWRLKCDICGVDKSYALSHRTTSVCLINYEMCDDSKDKTSCHPVWEEKREQDVRFYTVESVKTKKHGNEWYPRVVECVNPDNMYRVKLTRKVNNERIWENVNQTSMHRTNKFQVSEWVSINDANWVWWSGTVDDKFVYLNTYHVYKVKLEVGVVYEEVDSVNLRRMEEETWRCQHATYNMLWVFCACCWHKHTYPTSLYLWSLLRCCFEAVVWYLSCVECSWIAYWAAYKPWSSTYLSGRV